MFLSMNNLILSLIEYRQRERETTLSMIQFYKNLLGIMTGEVLCMKSPISKNKYIFISTNEFSLLLNRQHSSF